MFMVQLLVNFRFFIQELWERKSLQILYECRRAYHALLAQLFITLSLIEETLFQLNHYMLLLPVNSFIFIS